MEQEQIIPTRRKAKIPHNLSYSIGAKAISEALIGVPQFGALAVEFVYWGQFAHRHRTSDLHHVLYHVMEVVYSGPVRFHSASKNIEGIRPRWTITVHAVPRTLRHCIQCKLVAEALPLIRSWLLSNTHSIEREGRHGLVFGFDALKIELTHNEESSVEWHTAKVNRRSES